MKRGEMNMAQNQFSRTRILYGEDSMNRLAKSRVAVFGVGGVGGYVVEALARTGVGALDLIDDDVFSETNLNRQLLATAETLGRDKVTVAAERIARIAPDCAVRTYRTFFLPETQDQFDFSMYDYVVDAIDTVAGKLAIVEKAVKEGVPVISSMGAGNKIEASAFEVADIYETSVCPLAKVMRRECKKRGIPSLKVVYSREKPLTPLEDVTGQEEQGVSGPSETGRKGTARRSTPGSTAFAPSVAGLIIAGEVVNDITGIREKIKEGKRE